MHLTIGNNKALKSGIYYTLSTFLIKGITFISTPIFTRLMSKDEFGLYNSFISMQMIIYTVVTLSAEASLISAKFDFKKRIHEFINSMIWLEIFLCLLWSAVFNIVLPFTQSRLELSKTQLLYIMLYCLFFQIIGIEQTYNQFTFNYKKTVIINVLLAIITMALSLVLVCVCEDKVNGRIIGGLLPVIMIGTYLVIKRKIGLAYREWVSDWKYIIKICIPYVPHLLSITILSSMDRVMINSICGAEDTALYSLAYSCGGILSIFVQAVNSAYSPWLGEKLEAKDHSAIYKMTKTYVSGFLIIALGIMTLAPEILLIMGGHQYQAAIAVMPPVIIGCYFQFIYTMFVNVEQYSKKTGGMAAATVCAALLNFVLNLTLIPRYGYAAAAYTTLVSYIVLMLIHMLLVKRIKLLKVYNIKTILSCCGICCFAGCGIIFSYQVMVLRIIFLLIIVFIFLLYIKKIWDVRRKSS